VWITPQQPWRMTERPTAMTVDGNMAYLVGTEGWTGVLDLTTGRLVHEGHVGKVAFSAVARLGDGRLIAVGSDNELAVAYTLDPATLAATRVELPAVKSERTHNRPDVTVLPDGKVVIASFGLPLAVYDPHTWRPTVELSNEPDWSNLHLIDGALLATHGSEHFRIDLATRARTDLRAHPLAGAGRYLLVRAYAIGKPVIELRRDGGEALPLARTGLRIGIDTAGSRIASMMGSVVTVTSIPDGKVRGRYDLAPARATPTQLEFSGDRLVVVIDSIVRVIDLRTGAVTSPGEAPQGSYARLAVSDDGAVVATGAELWRVIDGTFTSGVRVGKQPLLTSAPGEVQRYATHTSKSVDDTIAPLVTVVPLDPREARRTFALEAHPLAGWLGLDGEVAVATGWTTAKRPTLYVSRGKALVEVYSHRLDARIVDVDVDAGLSAIRFAGTTHVVELKGTKTLSRVAMPACDEYGSAVLERGGPRVVTYSEAAAVLYERKTGRLLASIQLPQDISPPVFVPGEDEILLPYTGGFALWSPETGELRTLAVPHLGLVAVSHNGRYLAISLHDGRLALVDFPTLRAAMTPAKAQGVGEPPTCQERDPFQLDDEEDVGD
jgi:hypothetical protein